MENLYGGNIRGGKTHKATAMLADVLKKGGTAKVIHPNPNEVKKRLALHFEVEADFINVSCKDDRNAYIFNLKTT